MINGNIVFYLEDKMDIGFIEKIPQQNGSYQYEPFRGLGHLDMANIVKAGGKAKCSILLEGSEIVKFRVTNIPEYGVLQVELGWDE